jgi:hypothetical protein
MALLKIKQLRSNLSYNPTTNILGVDGALEITQTNPNNPSLAVSGSFYVVDSPNVASGSYNGEPIDGGTF